MGAPWNLAEARLVQQRFTASAANGETITFSAVPAGKIWCVIGFGYYPDVAETQTIAISKVTATGVLLGILNPVALNLNPARATFIEQGMEYFLLPGEYIRVDRLAHTVGSIMNAYVQFIEIDLPLYTYDEPQIVKRQDRALSSIRQRLGGGMAPGVRPPSDTGGDRGGRTGPFPK